jgi:hypothetical protein
MQFSTPILSPGQGPSRIHKEKVLLFLLLLSVLIFVGFFLATQRVHGPVPKVKFQTEDGSVFRPESERPLGAYVLGLDPDSASCFFMTASKEGSIQSPEKDREIREQLFWLRFELSHGQIMNALPANTRVYVALPDPKFVKESRGREEGWFKDYLKVRCHWTQAAIDQRTHFFKVQQPLIWTQDVGKIMGKDDQGRREIFVGPQDQDFYRRFVKTLCDDFPKDFTSRDLPDGVSAEGGDEDLVRTPDGKMTLLAGRHRAMRYQAFISGNTEGNPTLEDEQIKAAEKAFSSGFKGLPVVFLPRNILRNPGLGSEELFHLDMSVAVVGDGTGNRAFVPTYIDHPVDRMSGLPMDAKFVKSLQSEYDQIASQLKVMGFPVDRLEIDDHPVRSPANLVRFYDLDAGCCKVFLPKYPRETSGNGEPDTQEILMARLGDISTLASVWEKNPTEKNYLTIKNAIQSAWAVINTVPAESNEVFEYNAALFRKAGIDVIPVADFAWGSGGLHCQMLN